MQRRTAVVYARLSVIPPNVAEPFASQLADCRLAASRLEAEVVGEFCEEATGLDQALLVEAVDTAVMRRANYFLVASLDRFGRDKGERQKLAEQLKQGGVYLVTGPFTDGAVGA